MSISESYIAPLLFGWLRRGAGAFYSASRPYLVSRAARLAFFTKLAQFNWNADRMDWIIESSPSSQAAFAKGIASPYYRPGEFGAIISAEDQVLTPQVVACPDDQCVYLAAIATD